MPDLKTTTALGGDGPRSARHGPLHIEEITGVALASLAMRRGAVRPAPFGLNLPGPGGWVASGPVAAFWTGPDQWMVEAPGRADIDFAAELAALCSGCSVTEQTDGFVMFEIRSDADDAVIHALMAKLVNVDPARLPAGSATRVGLDHMSVFVIRRESTHLALMGMRSAAATLWHALDTAAGRLASDLG